MLLLVSPSSNSKAEKALQKRWKAKEERRGKMSETSAGEEINLEIKAE